MGLNKTDGRLGLGNYVKRSDSRLRSRRNMACYGSNDYYVWGSRHQKVRERNSPEPTEDSTEPTNKESVETGIGDLSESKQSQAYTGRGRLAWRFLEQLDSISLFLGSVP